MTGRLIAVAAAALVAGAVAALVIGAWALGRDARPHEWHER